MGTNTKIDQAIEYALWANSVQRLCLLESDGDVDAALGAANHIISTETPESFTPQQPSAALSSDNPQLNIPAPAGPSFPIHGPDEYPRNSANQFIPKLDLARAAREQEYLTTLLKSIPDAQHTKLNTAIIHLKGGGTVRHPSEDPGLSVDMSGQIADPQWAQYDFLLKEREAWVERDAARTERTKIATSATRLMRQRDPDYRGVDKLLKEAGAFPSELRTLSRARVRSKRKDADPTELEDTYEDIAEEVMCRIDEEMERDIEPLVPSKPGEGADNNTSLTNGHGPYFGMVGDEWHGPTPPGKGWVPSAPGPKGGKRWRRGNVRGKQPGSPGLRRGGDGDARVADGAGGRVGAASTRPSDAGDDTRGSGPDRPIGNQTDRNTQASQGQGQSGTIPELKLDAQQQRLNKYASFFRGRGNEDVAEWMDELQDHIKKVGKSVALKQLSEEQSQGYIDPKVQYKGTGYFEEKDPDTKFLKNYLDHVGIVLQTGTTRDPRLKVIASAPTPDAIKNKRAGDIIARETTIQTKLEESKLLPGLESSEDIHKVVGSNVTNFTPDVISKLDEEYGKGKWIVKSYGDEAYAGFGVFFPQRVKEIQRSSRQSILNSDKRLRPMGYSLYRDESGTVSGIKHSNTGTIYKFGSSEFLNIRDERVKRLGNIAAASAPSERGARLPMNAEESLRQDYGISIIKTRSRADKPAKVTGVTDEDGRFIAVGSKEWKTYGEYDTFGQVLERAIAAIESGQPDDARFMVQPAFKAVGVSDAARAAGDTWETSYEGRVHVSTRDGVASVIPYATMAGRGDAFPVVFHNKDTLAMEAAVQEAIDALPESERAGQTYAPDVMKTTEGWKVVELNASVVGGQSLWFEENPFVIDSYVSHLTGRDPMHVQFIRDLMRDKDKDDTGNPITPQGRDIFPRDGGDQRSALRGKSFATDDKGLEHRGKGPGGGQFVSQGSGGSSGSSADKPKSATKKKSTLKMTPVQELAAQSAWDSDIEAGVSHFDDLVKWLRKREGVSLKGVNEKYDKYNPESIKQLMEDYDWQSITEDDWDEWGPLDWKPSSSGEWNQFHRAAREGGALPGTKEPEVDEDDADDTSAEDLSDAEGDIEESAVSVAAPVPPKQEPPKPKEQPKPTAPPAPVPAAPTPPKEPPTPPTPPKEPTAPVKKVSTPNAPVIDRTYPGANTKSPPKVVSQEQHQAVVDRAIEKFNRAIKPSDAQAAQAREDIKNLGVNGYRRRLMSNNTDRRRRRNLILAEFGDGQRCPCLYCGLLVGHGTMEQDKIYTAGEGGRYTKDNIVPACGDCNKRRNNMPFEEAIKKVVRYAGPKAGEPGSEPEPAKQRERFDIFKDPWKWLTSGGDDVPK